MCLNLEPDIVSYKSFIMVNVISTVTVGQNKGV
jgi:hypothetical protein